MPASESAPPPRPRSVVRGCLFAGGGAALVLVACLAVVGQLDSAELREEIEQAPNPFGVVVDPDDVLRAMRVMLTGVAVLSITAVVFAVYAFRGHRPSRIGLAVLVPVMLVPSAVSGWAGLIPALLAVVGVVLLWSPASRDWFAAVGGGAAPARAVSTQRGDAMSNPTPPPGQEPQDPSGPPPPPQYGSGYGEAQPPPPPPPAYEPPPAYDPQQGQQAYPQGQPPYGSYGYEQPSPYPRKRPGIGHGRRRHHDGDVRCSPASGCSACSPSWSPAATSSSTRSATDPDLRADLVRRQFTLSQLGRADVHIRHRR